MMMKKIKGILLGTIILIVVFLIVNFIYIKVVEKSIQDNYNQILSLHKGEVYELYEFPILEQTYYYSCSISMICSMKEYYGELVDEDTFMKQNNINMDSIGMSPKDVHKYLQLSINDYNVTMKENIKDSEVINIIINQLKEGIPIPIFYSTIDITNMTRFGTHYSTVISIDIDKNKIKIANVYGYIEELSIKEFLQYLKHNNDKMETNGIIKIAKSLGIIKNNTLYVLEKE